MHSCIYEGRVRHRRFGPIDRQFSYPLFWSMSTSRSLAHCLDAVACGPPDGQQSPGFDEPTISGRRTSRWTKPCGASGIATRWRPQGPIRLLTHFRYLGFEMNPVSLYYCLNARDASVQAVVAEVNNTPWNEQHCYVLDLRAASQRQQMTTRHAKEFHVSPFLRMEMEYCWRLSAPGERLRVAIKCQRPRRRCSSGAIAKTYADHAIATRRPAVAIPSADIANTRRHLLASIADLAQGSAVCTPSNPHRFSDSSGFSGTRTSRSVEPRT